MVHLLGFIVRMLVLVLGAPGIAVAGSLELLRGYFWGWFHHFDRDVEDQASVIGAGCFCCRHIFFGACCLDVRTITFCQLMGFPLSH